MNGLYNEDSFRPSYYDNSDSRSYDPYDDAYYSGDSRGNNSHSYDDYEYRQDRHHSSSSNAYDRDRDYEYQNDGSSDGHRPYGHSNDYYNNGQDSHTDYPQDRFYDRTYDLRRAQEPEYDPCDSRLDLSPRSPPFPNPILPPQVEPKPTPTSPSPEYIQASLEPSTSPVDPPVRKLVILDLNGTLLFRGQPPPLPPPAVPPYKRRRYEPPPRRQRPIHPRPYLTAFRSFLFHPETRKWLDCMIWSSAQPHNVGDMVDACFGTDGKNFDAVWARDTLGLAENAYHQKSQTTKDLAKPWNFFYESMGTEHSARTTLLIDDTPAKAHLQPYNHVCVSEYVHDEPTRPDSKSRPSSPENKEERAKTLDPPPPVTSSRYSPSQVYRILPAPVAGETDPISDMSLSSDEEAVAPVDGKKEAPRMSKRARKRANKRKREAPADNHAADPPTTADTDDAIPDEKLHPASSSEPPCMIISTMEPSSREGHPASEARTDSSAPDDQELALQMSKKARRRANKRKAEAEACASSLTPVSEEEKDVTLLAVIGVLSTLREESNVAGWVRAGGLTRDGGDDRNGPSPGPQSPPPSDPPSSSLPNHAPFPLSSQDIPGLPSSQPESPSGQDFPFPSSSQSPQHETPKRWSPLPRPSLHQETWFTDASTLAHWAECGKRALEALGINLDL